MPRILVAMIAAAGATLLLTLLADADIGADRKACAKKVLEDFGGKLQCKQDPDNGKMYLSLAFKNSALTDADLLHLIPALREVQPEELDLSMTKVTGKGFSALNQVERLSSLVLSGTCMDAGGLAEVGTLRSLARLKLAYGYLSLGGLAGFSGTYSRNNRGMLRLSLDHCRITHEGCEDKATVSQVFQALSPLGQQLCGLDLSGLGLQDGDLKNLCRFHMLTRLVLRENRLGNCAVANIARATTKRLTLLDISNNYRITDIGIEILYYKTYSEKFRELDTLQLSNTGHPEKATKDEGDDCAQGAKSGDCNDLVAAAHTAIDFFGKLLAVPFPEQLSDYLLLDAQAVTNNGLRHLKGLTRLKKLDISYTATVWNADLASDHKTLIWLNLSGTGAGDDTLKVLDETMDSLQFLIIGDTTVTDGQLGSSVFPSLKEIDCRGSKVTEAGIVRFAARRANPLSFRANLNPPIPASSVRPVLGAMASPLMSLSAAANASILGKASAWRAPPLRFRPEERFAPQLQFQGRQSMPRFYRD